VQTHLVEKLLLLSCNLKSLGVLEYQLPLD